MKITRAQRYIILFLVAGTNGLFLFVPYMRFGFYDQMLEAFRLTNTQLGDLGALMSIVAMPGYLFGGILADKFSVRNLLTASLAGMAMTTAWYATLPPYSSLVIIYVLMAIFSLTLFWCAAMKTPRFLSEGDDVVAGQMYSLNEFVKGMTSMATGFIGVFIVSRAISGSVGVQQMLIMGAIIYAIWAVLVFIFVPKEFGITNESGAVVQPTFKETSIGLLKAGKHPGVWYTTILHVCSYWLYITGATYLGTFATQVLMVDSTVSSFLSIIRSYVLMSVAALVMTVILGKIKSKIKADIVMYCITLVLFVVMIMTKNMAVFCAIIGLVIAYVYCSLRTLWFSPMGELKIPLRMTGAATGIISFFAYTPDVLTQLIGGRLLDNYGSQGFDYIFYIMMGFCVLGIVVGFFALRFSKREDEYSLRA